MPGTHGTQALNQDRAEPESGRHTSVWKRTTVTLVGWILLLLGLIGLFLPLLQGILFILVGLALLAREYQWARKLLLPLRSRYPQFSRYYEAARNRARAILRSDAQK